MLSLCLSECSLQLLFAKLHLKSCTQKIKRCTAVLGARLFRSCTLSLNSWDLKSLWVIRQGEQSLSSCFRIHPERTKATFMFEAVNMLTWTCDSTCSRSHVLSVNTGWLEVTTELRGRSEAEGSIHDGGWRAEHNECTLAAFLFCLLCAAQ